MALVCHPAHRGQANPRPGRPEMSADISMFNRPAAVACRGSGGGRRKRRRARPELIEAKNVGHDLQLLDQFRIHITIVVGDIEHVHRESGEQRPKVC